MQVLDDWKAFTHLVCSQLTPDKKAFFEQNRGANCFIVTGDGGAGKSSWIGCVTGEKVYVGSTLQSGTKSFSLVRGMIEEKPYIFLDMPGFNTDDFDDWDIFFRLMTCMAMIKQFDIKFRGVLYVDPMNGARVSPAARKILTWLSRFCGKKYMPNVTIITTKWDGLDKYGIEEKLQRVHQWKQNDLIKEFVGSRIYHHGLVQDNGKNTTLHQLYDAPARKSRAEKMIAEHYSHPSDLQLQISRELENGTSIHNTEAGKWLKSYESSREASGSSKDPEAEDKRSSSESSRESSGSSKGSEANGERSSSESSGFLGGLQPKDIKPWIDVLVSAVKLFSSVNGGGSLNADPFPFFNNYEDMARFSEYASYPDSFSTFDDFP